MFFKKLNEIGEKYIVGFKGIWYVFFWDFGIFKFSFGNGIDFIF